MNWEISTPSDFHLHLREGDVLKDTIKYSNHYHYCLIMPNLKTPITSLKLLREYKNEILKYCKFIPLMTMYLNLDNELNNEVTAVKLYPKNATTNSNHGVDLNCLNDYYHIFSKMQELNIVLCIHGEDNSVDIFDREKIFLEKYMKQLVNDFPKLKIVLEHVSTREGVDFVINNTCVFATITPQHLLLNRNDIFISIDGDKNTGGLQPHNYCLPILKREEDRLSLIDAVKTSNKFFLGTDSAPHSKDKKECSCGCAGCFNSPVAIQLLAEMFEKDILEQFISIRGCMFYGLELPKSKIDLIEKEFIIPSSYKFGNGKVVPLCSGKKCKFTIRD